MPGITQESKGVYLLAPERSERAVGRDPFPCYVDNMKKSAEIIIQYSDYPLSYDARVVT